MATGAIITGVIMALVFAFGLIWCFRQWGKNSGKWDD